LKRKGGKVRTSSPQLKKAINKLGANVESLEKGGGIPGGGREVLLNEDIKPTQPSNLIGGGSAST